MTKKPPATLGIIYRMPLEDLHPHPLNPYGVRDDPAMQELVGSVKENGVLIPAIARPRKEGGYELISGHRRKYACEQLGQDTMPVMVLNLKDDDAIIRMIDSNIQRENILPSERAKAYKLKMEAVKRKAGRPQKGAENNSPKISANFRSDDSIGDQEGISGDTIRNYISLTNLTPPLMQMVDDGKIALSPAYQLASLNEKEQELLVETIGSEQSTPSLSQAQRLKKFSQDGHLSIDVMRAIMGEEKKSDLDRVTFTSDTLRKYFPRSYTPARMQETIIKLLEQWQRKRQRDQER